MGQKLTADTITQTFNLAAVGEQVDNGYRFMVALPLQAGGAEAYEEWVKADAGRPARSTLNEMQTFIGITAQAILFTDQKLAQAFCNSQKDKEGLGDLSVVSVSYSEQAARYVAAPLQWSDDKAAAIARMMRK